MVVLVTARTCSVDGCPRPHRTRGFCAMHYKRVLATGTPGGPAARPARGTCSVGGCDRPHDAKRYCRAHYCRWRTTGDTGGVQVRFRKRGRACSVVGCERPHCGSGLCNPHWQRQRRTGHAGPPEVRGPDHTPGYAAAHHRVWGARGPAREHHCIECGTEAQDWAYDHTDPAELTSPSGSAYSLDPAHYRPMCRADHARFDNEHRSERTA